MLHSIYGLSQNYARTEFEIFAHLSEVTGAFGKFLFKLKQPERAKEFLPKMFGWAIALAKKVKAVARTPKKSSSQSIRVSAHTASTRRANASRATKNQ